jgi:hypothetical protein
MERGIRNADRWHRSSAALDQKSSIADVSLNRPRGTVASGPALSRQAIVPDRPKCMAEESVLLGGRYVRRMGFGAMQLPGPGVFGPPKDRTIALSVLRRAIDAGVNHIDTAQFYGPDVANELLRDALSPYPDDLVIVSKVGAARDDQGQWHGAQRPDQLRAGVEANLESLGLE